ncbi:hypothetical protein [Clostridium sp. UBA6640]|uniref:hypothetical protein n=1 Tax=Clostridium sp. UBA6640 TaxID=1946370 RepID=UPI0025BD7A24|nr:hypothetical protein [Clostridium sp. UBA6640]
MKRSSKTILCLVGLTLILKVGLEFISKEDPKETIRKNILYQREYRIIKSTPVEITIQIDESYMPKDDKLLSYFNEPIEVKELVYEGNNSEVYLDRIQGDDNSFLRLYFNKKQNIEKDRGEFLSIGTVEYDINKDRSFIYDRNKSVKVYDGDDKLVENNALWLSNIRESEDFIISIKKDVLNKVKYPLTVKILNFNIINYEENH